MRIPPKNTGMGHLTVVPQDRFFIVRKPLSSVKFNQKILPERFRVFRMMHFSCSQQLTRRAKASLLNRLTEAFLDKLRSPKFLRAFADNMRMGAVNTVYFTFRYHEEERAVYLHVKGITQEFEQTKTEDATITRLSRQADDAASIETDVFLLKVGKGDLV